MEKILKKERRGVVVRLYSMEVKHEYENIPGELKSTLENKFLKGYLHLGIMNIKLN
jgi:hypothetical protein